MIFLQHYFNATCILPQSFSDETYFCTGPHKTDPKQLLDIYVMFLSDISQTPRLEGSMGLAP